MFKFRILVLFFCFYSCGQFRIKRPLEGIDDGVVHMCKKRKCGDGVETFGIGSWEDGFVRGVIHGWESLEYRSLSCGCYIADVSLVRQLYDFFNRFEILFDGYNAIYIFNCLVEYLKEKQILLDPVNHGMFFLPGDVPAEIKERFFDYNRWVKRLNAEHSHDFSMYILSYIS